MFKDEGSFKALMRFQRLVRGVVSSMPSWRYDLT